MNLADLTDQDPVFRLKGNMLAITVLELARNDLARLDRQLAEKVAKAPNFFNDTPVLLGLEHLAEADAELDLGSLLDICHRHGLLALGARASRPGDIAAVEELGLPLLPPASGRERPLPEPIEAPPPEPAEAEPAEDAQPAEPEVQPTLVITRPVRGGQQIYAHGGDLVVLSAVSPGAELIADGNIHVYGPLRGRVLAGANGNVEARIFCQQLTAELLSIAGRYKVAEDLRRSPQWGKAVQVSLSGDVLNITRL
ncbi:septum site-determining protein MinC [Pseudomonas sp. MAP12]|uniref:Probable septum site-determining protein MinC n=1 Tax=Geopseudomonas aromaticivorans TaxID=2849492 RepID=A0ABS6MVK3_9GAMM|nr:septum site-determining protein MinC [Pseudomonas aromaticivorans]MBV2132816.1 septum site-determining protein MinC [Pseudomonas aromaticivorans]